MFRNPRILFSVVTGVVAAAVLYFIFRSPPDAGPSVSAVPGPKPAAIAAPAPVAPPAKPPSFDFNAVAKRGAEILAEAAPIRQEILAGLRAKNPRTPADCSLLALNSTGAARTAFIAEWVKLEPDNAAPHLLSALDTARAGRIREAMTLTKEALKLPRADDYAVPNALAETRKVAAASGRPLMDVYGAVPSASSQGYHQSAESEYRQLGEIIMGGLMDETPHTPKEEDREHWLTALAMANKIGASTTQSMMTRMSALYSEREILRQMPEAFAEGLDRPRTQYLQELVAEDSAARPLMGVMLGLHDAPAERVAEFLEAVEQSGEWEALSKMAK